MTMTSTIRAIAHALPASTLSYEELVGASAKDRSRRSIGCRGFGIVGWFRRGSAPPIWRPRRPGD